MGVESWVKPQGPRTWVGAENKREIPAANGKRRGNETVEGGAHIVAGMNPRNIIEAVETVVMQSWGARYDLEDGFTPSSVVINSIRSQITNFF